MLLYIHRNRKVYQGRGAQDGLSLTFPQLPSSAKWFNYRISIWEWMLMFCTHIYNPYKTKTNKTLCGLTGDHNIHEISQFNFVTLCWWLLNRDIFGSWADFMRSCCMWFWVSDFSVAIYRVFLNIHQSCVLTELFACYMAGAMWNCCHLVAHFVSTLQPCTSL